VEAFLSDYPRAVNVFVAHAMACVGCPLSRFHSLAEAAESYSLDLSAFLLELQHEIRVDSTE